MRRTLERKDRAITDPLLYGYMLPPQWSPNRRQNSPVIRSTVGSTARHSPAMMNVNFHTLTAGLGTDRNEDIFHQSFKNGKIKTNWRDNSYPSFIAAGVIEQTAVSKPLQPITKGWKISQRTGLTVSWWSYLWLRRSMSSDCMLIS